MASKDKKEFFDKKKKDSSEESIGGDNTELQDELKDIDENINISEKDIFTGNEDFYKILEESSKENKSNSKVSSKTLLKKHHTKSLSLLQKILLIGIVIISLLIVFAIFIAKKDVENDSKLITDEQIENNSDYTPPVYVSNNDIEETKKDEDQAYVP